MPACLHLWVHSRLCSVFMYGFFTRQTNNNNIKLLTVAGCTAWWRWGKREWWPWWTWTAFTCRWSRGLTPSCGTNPASWLSTRPGKVEGELKRLVLLVILSYFPELLPKMTSVCRSFQQKVANTRTLQQESTAPFPLTFLFSLVRIIAVSYEARAHGVTRNMWADDAKKLCPDLQVARVRESHGKADLTW